MYPLKRGDISICSIPVWEIDAKQLRMIPEMLCGPLPGFISRDSHLIFVKIMNIGIKYLGKA